MLRTMLDAADGVLRVHYKSMKKRDFHFHNVTYLGEVDIFHKCLKNFFLLK